MADSTPNAGSELDDAGPSAIYRGRLPDGRPAQVTVRGECIQAVDPLDLPAGVEALPWILPPLVDLQHNGSLGVYYHQLAKHPPGTLRRIGETLRRHGVGRCLLTLATAPLADLEAACATIDAELRADPDLARLYVGVFFEGLFVSPEDGWRGAHRLDLVQPPDTALLRRFDTLCGGRIRVVNVAPELPGGLGFIADAVADGRTVSLGHCNPDADTIDAAIDAGARWVTHFGNGAAPLVHRFRNPFWTFLARPELRLGLIADGFHLPPDLLRVALACKGRDGAFLVSDASGYAGCEPGAHTDTTGRDFVIEPSGHLHLAGSEILMGAWHQLDRGVDILMRQLGLSLPDAWRLASEVPSAALSLPLPHIAVGEDASFILAHDDGGHRGHAAALRIVAAVHHGRDYLCTADGCAVRTAAGTWPE